MLGNLTMQQSSAGCNVTSCNYDGYVNGTINTMYGFQSDFIVLLSVHHDTWILIYF